MLPYHTVNLFLRCAPDELREIILEIRNIVFSVVPDVQEEISGKRLVYFRGQASGPVKSGTCGIQIRAGAVQAHFTHGAFIADPH